MRARAPRTSVFCGNFKRLVRRLGGKDGDPEINAC